MNVGWSQASALDHNLAGLVLNGSKINQGMAGVPAGVNPSTRHTLCHFRSSSRWSTGVAVADPNDSQPATVTLSAYAETSTFLGDAHWQVPAHGKMAGYVDSLFGFAEDADMSGWIEVISDVPVVSFYAYVDKVYGGFAAETGGAVGSELYLPYYNTTSRWWTLFALANPSATLSVQPTLQAHGEQGIWVGQAMPVIPVKGMIYDQVKTLFGIATGP